jgi:hypothetical protein
VQGGKFTQLVPLNLISRSAQDANLRASNYRDPLPDSAGRDRTVRLVSADISRRYVLVPDVSGCFR